MLGNQNILFFMFCYFFFFKLKPKEKLYLVLKTIFQKEIKYFYTATFLKYILTYSTVVA